MTLCRVVEGPEQLGSHGWQEEDVGLRNCDFAQVERQWPLARTGRSGGQAVHWLKAPPEHEAQSGWHNVHEVDVVEEKVFEGQVCTHLRLRWQAGCSRRRGRTWGRQRRRCRTSRMLYKEESLVQRKGEEKGGGDVQVQVNLSCDETTVPVGHASTHCLFDRNEPGMHAVHWSLLAIDAWWKSGIRQAEHLHAKQHKHEPISVNPPLRISTWCG